MSEYSQQKKFGICRLYLLSSRGTPHYCCFLGERTSIFSRSGSCISKVSQLGARRGNCCECKKEGRYAEQCSERFCSCHPHPDTSSLKRHPQHKLTFWKSAWSAMISSYPQDANIPLIQSRNEISLWSLRQKAHNLKPARLLIVSRSAARGHRILQNLMSRTRSLQFWRIGQASDKRNLRERWLTGGGAESTEGRGTCRKSAEKEERGHLVAGYWVFGFKLVCGGGEVALECSWTVGGIVGAVVQLYRVEAQSFVVLFYLTSRPLNSSRLWRY